MGQLTSVLLLLVGVAALLPRVSSDCNELDDYFSTFKLEDLLKYSEIRTVSPSGTQSLDHPSCLCREVPCATPKYALLGNDTTANNITLILSPGTHVLDDGLPIHNSSFVALVGVGDEPHVSQISCGKSPNFGTCSLKNIHIRNSSFVYISGLTFSQCQPLVSTIHVQNSEYVVFENCTFR